MDKGIVLACGREVKKIREVNTGDLDFTSNPVVLARVVLDTSFLKKPLVKIDFSTFIQVFTPVGATVGAVLDFELRRNCDGEIETLKEYQYVINISNLEPESPSFDLRDTFEFTFCDNEILCKKKCCIYTVELLRIDVLGGEPNENTIIIEDSSIRAIAQGRCD